MPLSSLDAQSVPGGHSVKGSPVDAQDFGRLFFVSAVFLEDFLDVHLFQFGQGKVGGES